MPKSNLVPAAPVAPSPSAGRADPPERDDALDLTRASITLLVIAHHAVLAYHRYAPPAGPFTRANLIWGAFPVVDTARAPGLDAFTLWNDSFFMAMMFLLSGLFVPRSLARKGAGRFLRDRGLRLGLPFIIGAAVLAPLAYLPAYLERAAATGSPEFWKAWLGLGVWPSGPVWFLWVLLAFGAVATALYSLVPRATERLAGLGSWLRERPLRACLALGVTATAAYWIATQWVSGFDWLMWGPFNVQTARLGLYAVYFFFGCALGAGDGGIAGDWMARHGPLARRWRTWQAVAGVIFVAFAVALVAWLMNAGKGVRSPLLDVAATVLFAVTGVATTFAMLAFFARWGHRRNAVTASLARNAYAMYIVHYGIVTWLQYLLLGAAWPGLVKAALVTALAIGTSWGAAILLRRMPGVARVV